jgi:hypothetical protein
MFWKDLWFGGIASDKYAGAYSFVINDNSFIQDFLTYDSLANLLHLPLSPEAREEIRELQTATTHIELTHASDSWTYSWGTTNYTSSQFYKFRFRNIVAHITYSWLWKSKCTPKMKLFCLLILLDRLNTRNMLRRRHFNINFGYPCPMCDNPPEETLEHLIFSCPFSEECWQQIGMIWQNNWNRQQLIQRGKEQWNKPMFMEIFIVAAWNIWKERTNLVFNGVTPNLNAWKQKVKTDMLLLVHRLKRVYILSFSSLQESCNFLVSVFGTLPFFTPVNM